MATADLLVATITGALTTNLTGFLDVPGLTFNVNAGGAYRFECGFRWAGSTTAATMKCAMGGTCTLSYCSYKITIGTALAGTSNNLMQSDINPTWTTITGSGAAAQATPQKHAVRMEGVIVVSSAGTFKAVASSTAGSAVSTIASGDGRMILEQIG